ncbi:MAG: NADH-quinone oxidoreductase subunit L [Gemmatimonadaceae bacterium]|nr:NADH-quinone oxidoreductase subunit L [Gemmatimonadaceae bacterium]
MSPLFATIALVLIPLGALAVAPAVDLLTGIMLSLVTFIALVIDRYAQRYLDGQAAAPFYRRWFVSTIAATSLLVTAGDLRLLALAWTLSSLSLHQLLTFFADRPQAQVAAHKKFLLSRLADVVIYAAVFLLGRSFGTYDIAAITAAAPTLPQLPTAVHAAGFLLVAGVALRSAQLPFHGWLIQVMEAPTPVSALLHAGVVNIGGYVLIRLAGLMGLLSGPMAALVAIGTITAVLAALVTMTRVSVKVALAWSTAAQMGFMLLECGLGAWELALLHLVAHSCYKAYAFLGSGGVVAAHARRALAPAAPTNSAAQWLLALAASATVAAATALIAWPTLASDRRAWVAIGLLALAIAPLFAAMRGATWGRRLALGGVAVSVAALYSGWHSLATALLPVPAAAPATPTMLTVVVTLVAFAMLFAVQTLVAVRPTARFARALQAWAFAGFHLDDLFTRATFFVWPPRHVRQSPTPVRPSAPRPIAKAA